MTATNQFAKNFNRYGGGDTAPGLDLVYEPLFRLSSKDGGQLLPMLAESAEHSEDGTEVTYHLRKGVTWSDGEPFTAKDVLFTLGSLYGTPNPEPAEDEFVWFSAPIETPDDHTVVIKYNSDQRQQEVNLARRRGPTRASQAEALGPTSPLTVRASPGRRARARCRARRRSPHR